MMYEKSARHYNDFPVQNIEITMYAIYMKHGTNEEERRDRVNEEERNILKKPYPKYQVYRFAM